MSSPSPSLPYDCSLVKRPFMWPPVTATRRWLPSCVSLEPRWTSRTRSGNKYMLCALPYTHMHIDTDTPLNTHHMHAHTQLHATLAHTYTCIHTHTYTHTHTHAHTHTRTHTHTHTHTTASRSHTSRKVRLPSIVPVGMATSPLWSAWCGQGAP